MPLLCVPLCCPGLIYLPQCACRQMGPPYSPKFTAPGSSCRAHFQLPRGENLIGSPGSCVHRWPVSQCQGFGFLEKTTGTQLWASRGGGGVWRLLSYEVILGQVVLFQHERAVLFENYRGHGDLQKRKSYWHRKVANGVYSPRNTALRSIPGSRKIVFH